MKITILTTLLPNLIEFDLASILETSKQPIENRPFMSYMLVRLWLMKKLKVITENTRLLSYLPFKAKIKHLNSVSFK